MSTAAFLQGAKVTLSGVEFALNRLLPSGEWQLEATSTGELRNMSKTDMLDAFIDSTLKFAPVANDRHDKSAAAAFRDENTIKQFDQMPKERQDKAKVRRMVVTGILAEYGDNWQVREIGSKVKELWVKADQSGSAPHPNTVWRWTRRYLASGKDIRSLVDCHHRRGNFTARVPKDLSDIVEKAVDKIYLTEERQTLRDTLDYAITEVVRANKLRLASNQLPLPTITLIKGVVAKMPQFDRYAARYGRPAAERRFHAAIGVNAGKALLDRVEIDHTRMDVFVVDDETFLPLGRPWLTVCLDYRTRNILGFSLSFDPPSHTTVARALKHAMLPKTYLAKTYPSVKNQWNCYGVMNCIVVDNGPEFHSEALEAACYSLGIDIQYCPRKEPWFKGAVERVLGTLNRGVAHVVPGTTFSNFMEKGDYDAARKATVTLSTLREIIHIWICDYYHQRPHKGLGDIPAHAWKLEAEHLDIRLPANPKELDAILGKIATRRLTHTGIEINNLFYNSRELADVLRRLGTDREVTVRFSEDEMGHVHVLIPDTNEYLEVRAVDYDHAAGLTFWQHRVIRRYARKQLAGRTDKVALAEAKRQIQELVERDFFRKGRKTRVRTHRFRDGAKGSQSDQATSDTAQPSVVPVPSPGQSVPDTPAPAATVSKVVPTFAPVKVQRLPAAGGTTQQEAQS